MNTNEELECAQKNFNPWNGYEFHRPLGSINRIRKEVSAAGGNVARQATRYFARVPSGGPRLGRADQGPGLKATAFISTSRCGWGSWCTATVVRAGPP